MINLSECIHEYIVLTVPQLHCATEQIRLVSPELSWATEWSLQTLAELHNHMILPHVL